MDQERALHLAQLVLTVHAFVALFVIFGMVVVPIGACRGWPFVRVLWWRALHAFVVLAIAAQKAAGATCFLSVWEFDLVDRAGAAAAREPLAQTVLTDVMHWDLPLWFFTVLYIVILAYTVVLWWRVPPRRASARRAMV